MKLRLTAVFLLGLYLAFPAQNDSLHPAAKSSWYVGGCFHYGFLWSHHHDMAYLVQKHILAGEIDVTRQTSGNYDWQMPYHFPVVGVALHVIPLGNPARLGTGIGLYPFINFPLGEKHSVSFRVGWGIGWVTKPFDPETNHKNIVIGTHLNACFAFRLLKEWRISQRCILETGIGLTHFSNGAFRFPNLGLNLPLLDVGIHYSLSKQPADRPNAKDADPLPADMQELLFGHQWHFSALVVTGANDVEPPGGRHYGLCSVLTSYMKQVSRKSRFGGGIDVMYSQAIQHILNYNGDSAGFFGSLQPGAKFAYEMVIGRLSFDMEIGAYLYSKYVSNGTIYNRWGLHYIAGKHLLVNFSLKTHFADAEYWETGLGWRF